MKRTASQQFLFEAYGGMYQRRHPALLETGEDALINSFIPETCPHCQSKHIKRFGQTSNHIQRYRCIDCQKTFTPVTGTIFEGHKISIREWIDYTLNIFRYVSINADSWNNRNDHLPVLAGEDIPRFENLLRRYSTTFGSCILG